MAVARASLPLARHAWLAQAAGLAGRAHAVGAIGVRRTDVFLARDASGRSLPRDGDQRCLPVCVGGRVLAKTPLTQTPASRPGLELTLANSPSPGRKAGVSPDN